MNLIGNNKLFAIIFVGVFELVWSDSLNFNNCGSEFKIWAVNIDDCDAFNTCHLQIGSDRNIYMNFTTGDVNTSNLRQEVFIDIYGIYTDTAVTPASPCANIICPVTSHVTVGNFKATMHLSTALLPFPADIYWSIFRMDTNRKVLCIRVPVEIID